LFWGSNVMVHSHYVRVELLGRKHVRTGLPIDMEASSDTCLVRMCETMDLTER